jgi:hypothetical protein
MIASHLYCIDFKTFPFHVEIWSSFVSREVEVQASEANRNEWNLCSISPHLVSKITFLIKFFMFLIPFLFLYKNDVVQNFENYLEMKTLPWRRRSADIHLTTKNFIINSIVCQNCFKIVENRPVCFWRRSTVTRVIFDRFVLNTFIESQNIYSHWKMVL